MRPKKPILVTRPLPFADELAAAIRAAGGCSLVFPVLVIADPLDDAPLQALSLTLPSFDWAIFISPTAVIKTFSRFDLKAWPKKLKIAAIGEGTASKLRDLALNVTAVPLAFNSESLLAHPLLQSVKDKKIIIFRGEGGRAWLAQTLAARGAKVSHAMVYRRALPPFSAMAEGVSAWKQAGIGAIVITSQEALTHLVFLVGEGDLTWLQAQPLLVTSPRIQAVAQQLGFRTIFLAKDASNKAIVAALKQWHLV